MKVGQETCTICSSFFLLEYIIIYALLLRVLQLAPLFCIAFPVGVYIIQCIGFINNEN